MMTSGFDSRPRLPVWRASLATHGKQDWRGQSRGSNRIVDYKRSTIIPPEGRVGSMRKARAKDGFRFGAKSQGQEEHGQRSLHNYHVYSHQSCQSCSIDIEF